MLGARLNKGNPTAAIIQLDHGKPQDRFNRYMAVASIARDRRTASPYQSNSGRRENRTKNLPMPDFF
jgi:hypothetical protein